MMFFAGALEYERPFLSIVSYPSILEIRSAWFLLTSSSSFLTSLHRLEYVDTTPAQRKYIRGTRLQEWTLRPARGGLALAAGLR